MDWLAEYLKAWSRHGINFGLSCSSSDISRCVKTYRTVLAPFNIIAPHPELPAGVVLTLVVDDECLVYRFPHTHRRKELRGRLNERFLNAVSLNRALEGVSEHTIVLLTIPEIYATEELTLDLFLRRLDSFLGSLLPTRRYAIRLHNPNYMLPDYFELLRRYGIANETTGSPVFTADFGILCGGGPNLDSVTVVRQAIEEKKTLFVYLNNQDEFPGLMELLDHDLRRLSPIRRARAI